MKKIFEAETGPEPKTNPEDDSFNERVALPYDHPHAFKDKSEFRAAIEDEYGLTDNPKKDKLYAIAWDMGHAYGYNEVNCYYDQLRELIED